MSGLAPVYTQIKDLGDSEIPMEDISRSPEPKEEPKTESSSCKRWCQDSQACQNSKRPCLRRLCGCCCTLLVFVIMVGLISGVAMFSYLGVKTYRCVNPRYSAITTFTFSDDEVKEFDLNVVSGFINVRTCPMAQHISLHVVRKAAQADLIDSMPMDKLLKDGVFKLNVLAPSFDFQHCQSAQVELIIPERLAEKQHLVLKAHTILGKISVNAPKHTFEKVTLLANLGMVKAERLSATQTIQAEARVGSVSAADIHKATGVSLKTKVGSICAHRINADEVDVQVETGRAWLTFFHTKVAKISSELGWISAWAFKELKHLDASVSFGRLNFSPVGGWNGKFSVESPFGWIDASHAKDVKAPVLEKNTPAIIAGSHNVDPKAKAEDVSSLTLKAVYGAVNFFLPAPEAPHH